MQIRADESTAQLSPSPPELRVPSPPEPRSRALVSGGIGFVPILRLITAALLAAVAIDGGAYTAQGHAWSVLHLDSLVDLAPSRQQASSPTPPPTATDAPAELSGAASSPAADVRSTWVGATEITWDGDWEYDAESSTDKKLALSRVDTDTGQFAVLLYAEPTDVTFDSPDAVLDDVAAGFVEEAKATDVTTAGSGTLEDGSVWRAYTFKLMGIPLTVLMAVKETPDGRFAVSTLAGSTDGFEASIESAQRQVLLNGEPIFLEGFDPSLVSRFSEEQPPHS